MQEILIGDVQGCAREFRRLVERARSQFGEDYHVSQVGDLVNKGPDNLAALEIMREEMEAGRGDFVLGNHELHLIRVLAGLEPLFPGDTLADVVESSESDEWLDWLRQQKLALQRSLAGTPALVVHASVHPRWALGECLDRARAVEARLASSDSSTWAALVDRTREPDDPGLTTCRDDLARLTTCRSVDPHDPDRWSKKPPGSSRTAWHAAWRLFQHDYGVVYGHWAQQGLVVAPGIRGLDTGCVYAQVAPSRNGRGGCLSAWLPQQPAAGAAGRLPVFGCPDDSFWTDVPLGPYLSGSEPYSFQPEPTPRGFECLHREVYGSPAPVDGREIVIVSGLPRSGTSMWMQMLQAGGLPILADEIRRPDEDNPRGYLELEAVKRIREDTRWLEQAPGHAVKVVAPLLGELPGHHRYAVLFSQRDLEEVNQSQLAMLRRQGGEVPDDPALVDAFAKAVSHVTTWLEQSANVRTLFLDYPEVLEDPLEAAVSVADFLSVEMNPHAMADRVSSRLYRQRHRSVK